jgi:dethiobiotin synthetase
VSAARPRIVFVTGTDTGIGKTLVSSAIAAALVSRGVRLAVAKPVETGCPSHQGALVAADARTLQSAARDPAPLTEICPHRFADPLAPALAAERAGTRIDVGALTAHLGRRAEHADLLLVEGAGGLLVPITIDTSFADLAAALGAAVVVVVGSRLGAVNHTLLTIDVLRTRGITLAGYVVNRLVADDDLAVATNDDLLARLTHARRLGAVPFLPESAALLAALRAGGAPAEPARAALAALGGALDLDALTAAV